MSEIFDLENIKKALAKAEIVEEDGNRSKWVFLGTVMALTPSGKYYTPWACSNVTQEEADEDEKWWEQAEAELQSIGCSLDCGPGDPCDLFAVQYLEDENVN